MISLRGGLGTLCINGGIRLTPVPVQGDPDLAILSGLIVGAVNVDGLGMRKE